MNSMDKTREFLKKAGLPGGDAYDLPDSRKRFKDGGQYRFEVPGIQGPKVMRALLEAMDSYGLYLHRVTQTQGIMRLTDAEIAAGIAAYKPEGARASVEQANGFTIVNDCYNANPDSMAAGLRALQRADAHRRVAILGDMGELGPTAERLHFETGVTAGGCGVDLLITCGPLSKHMAAGAKEAGVKCVLSFNTLSETIAALPDAIQPGRK